MKRILVTGVNGFVGLHLAKELSDNGIEVVGVGGAIGTRSIPDNVKKYQELDLTKPDKTSQIDFTEIDGVIHLAGLAAVGPSFDDPMLYMNTNVGIEVNLYEAALSQSAKPRFLIISSGSLYDTKATLPLSEKSDVDPSSPYAVSKIGQEQMALYYQSRGIESIIARPFNHIGPGQNPGFLIPDVAQQIVACENGKSETVLVGNLDAKRDYTDVRDIVRAYRMLIDKGTAGEIYNICSGISVSGSEIVNKLIALSNEKINIVRDEARMRPSDTPDIFGAFEKLSKATGWTPKITLDETLKDVIEDWRNRT